MEQRSLGDQGTDAQGPAPITGTLADAAPASTALPAPLHPVAPELETPTADAPAPKDSGSSTVRRRRLPRLGPHPRLRPIHIHVRVHTLDSLRYRDYRLFWFSTLSMSAGTWVHEFVIGWLTYDLTRSPLLTSLALGLGALPYLLVAPLGGVLADRFDRRKVLVVNSTYQAALTAGFSTLVVTGAVEPWHIFAFILAVGVSWAIHDPTRVAIVPNTVPRQNLVNAFALNGLAFNASRLAVPAVAGLLIALLGPGSTLYLASALFLGGTAAVLRMELKREVHSETTQGNPLRQLVEATRYTLKEPIVLTLTVLTAIPMLVLFPFVHGLLPVYAAEVFEYGPTRLGLMLSALGVGASVGTITIASFGDVPHKGRFLLLGLALVIVSMVVFSRIGHAVSPLPVLMVMAGSLTTYFTLSGAAMHAIIPDELRGRVSAIGVMTWGFLPLGSIVSGGLAARFGAPSATLIAGLFVAVVLAAFAPKLRRVWQIE